MTHLTQAEFLTSVDRHQAATVRPPKNPIAAIHTLSSRSMRELPILFSAPMVRALLAGTKTQTRRVVKWRDVAAGINLSFSGLRAASAPGGWVLESDTRTSSEWRCKPTLCPYGQPGDRLWVRECWARDDEDGALMYRADLGLGGSADDWERNRLDGVPRFRWRPSIHMPRAASRTTLEVIGVRVERLQTISEADAIAEGMNPSPLMLPADDLMVHVVAQELGVSMPVARYVLLWDSLNGEPPKNWNSNPWVWVVEFKRVQP